MIDAKAGLPACLGIFEIFLMIDNMQIYSRLATVGVKLLDSFILELIPEKDVV